MNRSAITLPFQPQHITLDKKAEILGAPHKLNPGMLGEIIPGSQPSRAFVKPLAGGEPEADDTCPGDLGTGLRAPISRA